MYISLIYKTVIQSYRINAHSYVVLMSLLSSIVDIPQGLKKTMLMDHWLILALVQTLLRLARVLMDLLLMSLMLAQVMVPTVINRMILS